MIVLLIITKFISSIALEPLEAPPAFGASGAASNASVAIGVSEAFAVSARRGNPDSSLSFPGADCIAADDRGASANQDSSLRFASADCIAAANQGGVCDSAFSLMKLLMILIVIILVTLFQWHFLWHAQAILLVTHINEVAITDRCHKNKTSDHRSQAMKSMRHGIATNHRITISLSPPCLNQRMYQLGGAVLFLLELIAVHLPTRTLR